MFFPHRSHSNVFQDSCSEVNSSFDSKSILKSYIHHLTFFVFQYWKNERRVVLFSLLLLILHLWLKHPVVLDHCLMMSLSLLRPTVYVVKKNE